MAISHAPAVGIPAPRTRRTARRVLFFGTYDARRYPRVRVLQEGFAALGDEVLECNVPLRLDTAARVNMLRRPWLVPLLAAKLASTWIRLIARSRRCRGVDLVVVGYMGHFDVHLARLLWPRTRRRSGRRPERLVLPTGSARERTRPDRVLRQLHAAARGACDWRGAAAARRR
jgi:hypothetical protein